ncbi:MAG: GNAT family N-acetyltransferase [Deltaproteobacteria bacterium]|nr:GNAT family N-acetyltransferase [Deltaproteobacteria bacterium]
MAKPKRSASVKGTGKFDLALRELDPSDIPEVVAIQQAITKKAVSRAWTSMVERHLWDSHGVGFVAVRGGEIVGFAIGEMKGESFGLSRSGWIETMGVAPHAMGDGIGKAMIDKLFEYFRRNKITTVFTALPWHAVDMVSFFRSIGFGPSDYMNVTRQL